MNKLLRLLKSILKAALFFTLFAFALNNQQDATVHFFFGQQWRLPMVLIVLIAFGFGLAVGVLGMLPLWSRRRAAARARSAEAPLDPALGESQRAPLAAGGGGATDRDVHGI